MAYLCIHLIFFLFLFPISALAQKNGIVPLGSTLTAGETSASSWLSPSGDFAFGFRQFQDKDLFLFSIWYYKIPDKTVVWFVYSIDLVPRGSTLKLDARSGLVLRDPQGLQLWSADVNSSQVDHGFMNDTDLILGDSLSSRQSATKFSQGRFYLRFLYDGNLVLATRSVPTNVYDDAEYLIVRLLILQFCFLDIYWKSELEGSLVFAGEYMFHYWRKGERSLWINSICHLEHGRPACACPEGYILLDPDDKYGSCLPNSSLGCGAVKEGSAENLYDFVVINDIDWPLSDFEQIYPSNETVCEQACLQDCFCVVAIFRDNSCWKKKLPLSNGGWTLVFGQKLSSNIAKVMPLSTSNFSSSSSRIDVLML
nr:G-type lectin S-receptor-like serine/threonine-protein kinase RLK1 [Coffea arabica]